MSISAPCIRRPVATALFMVAILLLGGTAYELLPVAALPNVSFPTITVTGQLPGTDAQTMASSVATPLEKQFGQIPYLTQMTSTSSLGFTQITLQFALNDDISAAATLVQAAINAASGQLPKDMFTQPTYHETNPADAPILVLGLTSDTLPVTTVDDYAESILAQKLSQVPGVGLVTIGGEQHPSIRIRFDPAQLAANGLDLEDIHTALTNVSVDQPKGALYGQARAFTLQTSDQILNPQRLGQTDHRLPQRRTDQGIRRRQSRHRTAGHYAEGLGQPASGGHPGDPATSRRQRDQHGAGG
jgi:multidrug efflux pump subunit AcrB